MDCFFGALPCPGTAVGLGKVSGAAGRAKHPEPWGWVVWAQLCGPSGHGQEPCSCKSDFVPRAASPHCLRGITHPEPTLCHGLQGSVPTCPMARPLLGTCAPVPAPRGSEVQGVPCHPCMAFSRGKRVSLVLLHVFKGSAVAGRWSRQ